MNEAPVSSPAMAIRCRTSSPDLSRFPDLFYLGPQRTGSTWLHANLVRHPQVHLHRDKETFYFSTLGQPQHPRYRFEYLEDYLDSFRESLGEVWLKNYHALRRCGLFYRPRRRADFTASYGVLPEEVIAQIVSFRPDLRGLVLVRDPVERAWSHMKKDLVRGRSQAADAEEFRAFLRSPEQMLRADYRGIIQRWSRALAPGHLFVAPYGRLTTDPVGLLNDISGFLGIRQLGAPSRRHATSRQNTTEGLKVPPQLREEAAELLAQASQSCQDLLGEIGEGRIY